MIPLWYVFDGGGGGGMGLSVYWVEWCQTVKTVFSTKVLPNSKNSRADKIRVLR